MVESRVWNNQHVVRKKALIQRRFPVSQVPEADARLLEIEQDSLSGSGTGVSVPALVVSNCWLETFFARFGFSLKQLCADRRSQFLEEPNRWLLVCSSTWKRVVC